MGKTGTPPGFGEKASESVPLFFFIPGSRSENQTSQKDFWVAKQAALKQETRHLQVIQNIGNLPRSDPNNSKVAFIKVFFVQAGLVHPYTLSNSPSRFDCNYLSIVAVGSLLHRLPAFDCNPCCTDCMPPDMIWHTLFSSGCYTLASWGRWF
jgi:hypothetical protein